MPTEPRFLVENDYEVFTGNELLVKGCLEVEGGVHLLTGYPGSPVAAYFDALSDIRDLLREKGMRAFQANNEALAVAAVNGSQMLPCRAIAAMKSVGVHVASDALALGNLAGAHPQGGAVIVMGDDPWSDSTQVPADSRFICQHMRMPVVEPGSAQELKDWINLSFKLSQAAGLYIGYVVTPAQADGGGTVWCRANQFSALNTRQRVSLETRQIDLDRVLLPPRTWQHELKLPERLALTVKAARVLGLNRIARPADGASQAPLGFIVTGMAGAYLDHLLLELGLAGQFPVLYMGMSYPADTQLVCEFAQACRTMVVIEERRSFLEKNIRDDIFRELPQEEAVDIASRLYGKKFPGDTEGIPELRGLNYSVLAQKLVNLLQSIGAEACRAGNGRLKAELARLNEASRPKLEVLSSKLVARTPTFCPGCPHRDSAAALLELRRNLSDRAYMRQHHGREPIDLVAHGDTGCYTMLMYPPTEQLMHNYSGMGLGGGTGSGIDPFITNKQIVFMGDSTFFHSGQVAISNAVKAGQDITFIILQNGTTAMTGHQDHAGTTEDMFGNRHPPENIERIVRGIAPRGMTVVRMDPSDRDRYQRTLEKTILSDGVKVMIADKECGITFNRARLKREREIVKKKGHLPRKRHMNVTPEVCEGCLECTKQTACPGLAIVDTDYGKKVDTDLTLCVDDGACERVRVSNEVGTNLKPCPSFEQVTVVHRKRRRYLLPNLSLDKLPDPVVNHDMSRAGAIWRCHMSGVGGMGIGLVSAILVRAGHTEGYRVAFQEKKGLAIRNGGVFSQIAFIRDDRQAADVATLPTTGNIPYGAADLLLGMDVLEAARAVDPREPFRIASPQRTCGVLNTHKQATVNVLLGRQDFDPDALREEVLERCQGDCSYARDLSAICEQRLGSKQFVNIMMLGVAYQLGQIPVSAHAIAWAIKDTIRREHRRNLKAFNIGRKLALEPRALPRKPQPETWEQLMTNKARILRKTRLLGRWWSRRYEAIVQRSMREMRDLPARLKYDLALRIYDVLQYQDHKLARRYAELVKRVYRKDDPERRYAATAAVIWNLAKVLLIKDEPYVAYLLTRFEKKQRDIAKYGVDVSNGDKLVYRHYLTPELNIGSWRLRLKVKARPWMLGLVRRFKWLRRLPGWHRREKDFRDWYIDLLDRLDLSTSEGYEQALAALRSPDLVNGYREVRYPKMEAARAAVEAELARPAEPGSAPAVTPDNYRVTHE